MSVVITCYKQAHYLGEAIESVLNQTYPRFEVIVVDDDSPDNPAAVAARYPAVRFVRQGRRLGTAAATRNAGLRLSKGQYVIFLDADDRLLPNALRAGVDTLKARPDCAFAVGCHTLISPDGSPLPTEDRTCTLRGEEHYLAVLRWRHLWTPIALMFRRGALEAVGGFNPSPLIKGNDDHELCLRLTKNSPFCCHNEFVGEYRVHDSNTSRDAAMMLKASANVFRLHRNSVKGNKRHEEAFESGSRRSREHFSEQVVAQIRARVRDRREWGKVFSHVVVLARYYPKGLITHAGRKLRRVFTRNGDSAG